MVKRFAGRIAVVTGAASGLGRSVALALHREGASRIVMLDSDAGGLGAVASDLGDAAVACPCDVADARAVAEALSHPTLSGGLDLLFTAAGVLGPPASVADCSPEDWERTFAVNVHGTFHAIHHAVPLMLRRGGGAIVTFGSVAGLAGSAVRGPYSATKGAIVMMTRSLALSHAAAGIRVNCVCPGPIPTPMAEASFARGGDAASTQAQRSAAAARCPLGRLGTVCEVTETVLFLASGAASYITGVALPIDGGRLA